MRKSLPLFVIVGLAVLAGLFWWLKPAPVATPDKAAVAPALPSPVDAGRPASVAAPAATPPPAPAATTFEFVVEHRRLVSSAIEMRVTQGAAVVVRVKSDVPDEMHLHGYDLEARLRPGETGELRFTADRSGRFPLELHKAGIELGALEVLPSP